MPKITFPENFLWGTATSAYQVEGKNINDWSQWEKAGARMLKIAKAHRNPMDFICGQACDSYHRYTEDFDLAKSLNTNAIRFGIEWSRLQNEKNEWNVEEILHYKTVLKEAQDRGFSVMLCLWHWTIPTWLEREGGWTSREAVAQFEAYVRLIVAEFGGMVDFWLTLNEPLVPAAYGYLAGTFPPGKKLSLRKFWKMKKNLAKAHNAAYDIIHERFPQAMVGHSMLSNAITAEPTNLPARGAAFLARYFANDWFINETKKKCDFLGLQYYKRSRLGGIFPWPQKGNLPRNDMGWELFPEGIYQMIKYWQKFGKPIIVTENGTADAKDSHRAEFIKNHLVQIHRAIKEGAAVLGYFHWSLLDNFEWAYGWGKNFGLFEVDRITFNRKMRESAKVYAEFCRNNGFDHQS